MTNPDIPEPVEVYNDARGRQRIYYFPNTFGASALEPNPDDPQRGADVALIRWTDDAQEWHVVGGGSPFAGHLATIGATDGIEASRLAEEQVLEVLGRIAALPTPPGERAVDPDIPQEPPLNSIVLDGRESLAWQLGVSPSDEGDLWYCVDDNFGPCWWEQLNAEYGPLTVLYTPPSASQPEPPVGAVVRDAKGGDVWQRYADRGWCCVTNGSFVRSGIPWEKLNEDFGPVDVVSPQSTGGA